MFPWPTRRGRCRNLHLGGDKGATHLGRRDLGDVGGRRVHAEAWHFAEADSLGEEYYPLVNVYITMEHMSWENFIGYGVIYGI